jgi:hypothetical protein
MVATRAQSPCAADSNPLLDAGILSHILSYVGPGEWSFVAAVSSLWKDVYCGVSARTLERASTAGSLYVQNFTCVPQMTLSSAVFASPSRVRLALEHGLGNPRECLYHAAAGRHASIAPLGAAHELGMKYSFYTMIGAAESNELSVVQFLHEQGCPWYDMASTAAARRGDVEMPHWMLEHGCDWDDYDLTSAVGRSGSIEMITWLQQQSIIVADGSTMAAAAEGGHIHIIEFLHAEQCSWHEDACNSAARHGHVDTLRWLHEHGCPWYAHEVCEAAAESGSIDTMIYLQQQGIEFTPELLTTMLNAAGARSKLAAAQWLRQQGVEVLSQHIIKRFYATWEGETLEWARAEGCTSPTE